MPQTLLRFLADFFHETGTAALGGAVFDYVKGILQKNADHTAEWLKKTTTVPEQDRADLWNFVTVTVASHNRKGKKAAEEAIRRQELRASRGKRTYGRKKRYIHGDENKMNKALVAFRKLAQTPTIPDEPKPIDLKPLDPPQRWEKPDSFRLRHDSWNKVFQKASEARQVSLATIAEAKKQREEFEKGKDLMSQAQIELFVKLLLKDDQAFDAVIEGVIDDGPVQFALLIGEWAGGTTKLVTRRATRTVRNFDLEGGKLLQRMNNWLDDQGVK